MKTLKIILLGMLSLTFQSCGSDQNGLTKEEAEKRKIDGDKTDYCEKFGWYDDGICDDFCETNDPECAVNCAAEPVCQPGYIEIDGCPIEDGTDVKSDCVNITTCGSISCTPQKINCLAAALQCPEGYFPTQGECPPKASCIVVVNECAQLECTKRCSAEFNIQCGLGEFCRYQLAEVCGALNADGFCEKKTQGCPATEYDPVCGCDGINYDYKCAADVAGVSISSFGVCGTTCESSADCAAEGKTCFDLTRTCQAVVCGGNSAEPKRCNAGEFCLIAPDVCGINDATGVCTVIPMDCSDQSAPVCGCDNLTYENECTAWANGASIATTGVCESD